METQIKNAVAHFEKLLREQIARAQNLNAAKKQKDENKTIIGLIDGDGIGPIIMAEAKRALEKLLADEIAGGSIELRVIEGLTIENRLALGQAVPDDVMAAIKECDVLLKGPTTTPSGGKMESANVSLRRALDLYANVRPVCVPEENIDWTFFRENTEGEYTLGSRGIEISDTLTMDFKVTTVEGTKRIARSAFEFAKKNGKTHVAIVTKSNIMKKTDGLFSRICHEIAAEYPDIQADEYYIDIMSANLVNPAIRSNFQVFVLPNLYGDIITDEAAEFQGGVGTAGSANIGKKYAMFEAIHGSAPRMIAEGRGKYADPCSMLRAAAMLLSHIGKQHESDLLSKALDICMYEEKKLTITGRDTGCTCEEFGNYVMETVQKLS